MKVAKATEEDFDNTIAFINAAELCLEKEKFSFSDPADNWTDLDDDDEDKQLILKIRKGIAADEGCDEESVDNRILMYEFLSQKFKAASCCWRRVYWAASVLIETCCDPTQDVLAWVNGAEIKHVEAEQ